MGGFAVVGILDAYCACYGKAPVSALGYCDKLVNTLFEDVYFDLFYTIFIVSKSQHQFVQRLSILRNPKTSFGYSTGKSEIWE
jgi:hypothetical protein